MVPTFVENRLVIPDANKKRCHSAGRQAGPNLHLHGGKVTALACHPTKKVNKAVELTCLSTNINLSQLGSTKHSS
jgi:hypothetical protein